MVSVFISHKGSCEASFIDAVVKLHIWGCLLCLWRQCDRVEREVLMEESGVSEHLGGHQDLRERVNCAGSHGRALTLVSFTKGVSPPQRSTLYIWSLKPWSSQRKSAWSETQQLCIHFLWEQNKKMDSRGVDLITCTRLPLTSKHLNTQSHEKCLYVSPSNPGLSRSRVTCPAALPDTSGHQRVNMPPHQAMKT